MGWLRPSHLFLVNYSERSSSMQKFLFFVFLLALGDVALAQTPQQLVQDALQRQQAGDLAGAVPEYSQFLKLHPEATAIQSHLGVVLAGLRRLEVYFHN